MASSTSDRRDERSEGDKFIAKWPKNAKMKVTSQASGGGCVAKGAKLIVCSNCEYENPPGSLVCARCGLPLSDAVRVGTTRQLDQKDDSVGRPHWGSARFGPDSVLVIHVRDRSEPLILRPGSELVLGRFDPVSGFRPDLDLSPYNAVEKGVSRLHAAIRRQDDSLSLMDLGSANSTYLNGQRLVPHQPRVLRDGDELRLGRLVMQVYFRHDVPA